MKHFNNLYNSQTTVLNDIRCKQNCGRGTLYPEYDGRSQVLRETGIRLVLDT
jgi:hypothetical protein